MFSFCLVSTNFSNYYVTIYSDKIALFNSIEYVDILCVLCIQNVINAYIIHIPVCIILHLQSIVGHVKLARLTYKRSTRDLAVQLLEAVQVRWSTNLHLKLLTLIGEIEDFHDSLSVTDNTPKSSPNRGSSDLVQKKLNVRIKGQIFFGISLSSRHQMAFTSGSLHLVMAIVDMSYHCFIPFP